MDKTVAVIGAGPDRPRLGDGVRARRAGACGSTTATPAQLAAARAFIAASLDEQAALRARRRCRARRARASSTCSRPRGRARRRRLGAGKSARGRRGQARGLRALDRHAPPGRRARELDVGDSGVALHRKPGRARALPRRASGQSAASGADRRAVRRAVDRAGDDRARAARVRGGRTGADRRAARARRLHPQPPAGRAAVRSDAPGRRGLRVARRPRQDGARRPRAALVVHGTVRDHRAERARAASPTTARATAASTAGSPPTRPAPDVWDADNAAQRRRRARRAALAARSGKRAPAGAIAA